jgi:hypothetical protein
VTRCRPLYVSSSVNPVGISRVPAPYFTSVVLLFGRGSRPGIYRGSCCYSCRHYCRWSSYVPMPISGLSLAPSHSATMQLTLATKEGIGYFPTANGRNTLTKTQNPVLVFPAVSYVAESTITVSRILSRTLPYHRCIYGPWYHLSQGRSTEFR